MKTTLIVIQNDADHAQAKALVEKLMGSHNSADRVRMVAQARLIDAYERTRWPRRAATLPDLLTTRHTATERSSHFVRFGAIQESSAYGGPQPPASVHVFITLRTVVTALILLAWMRRVR